MEGLRSPFASLRNFSNLANRGALSPVSSPKGGGNLPASPQRKMPKGAPGSKQEASTPIAEEKENSFPVFDGDNTIEEQTSIVNESYENSSSWESYEVSSSQEAIEAEKYLDENTPNESTTTKEDESKDKYLAIARLDHELE